MMLCVPPCPLLAQPAYWLAPAMAVSTWFAYLLMPTVGSLLPLALASVLNQAWLLGWPIVSSTGVLSTCGTAVGLEEG